MAWCDLDTDWHEGWTASLTPVERARATGFARTADTRRFVAGRHLVRSELARRSGGAPAMVDLRIDAAGRPYLPAGPAFSIAHSGRCVAAAFAGDPRTIIGLDVEEIRRDIDPLALSRQAMTAAESARIAAAGDPVAAFYRLWTRKEAVLKAIGTGFRTDPRTIQADGDDAVPGCRIIDLAAPAGHVAALAWGSASRDTEH